MKFSCGLCFQTRPFGLRGQARRQPQGATADSEPWSGPAVDGARPMLHRTENAKEHADRDKSGRRGDGGGRRRSRSDRRRCGHRQATIIVMEIMLLLMMIRLIWLIPGIMRRLTHSNQGEGYSWQGRASEACNRVVGSKRHDVTFLVALKRL
jgi:hypothetical protein